MEFPVIDSHHHVWMKKDLDWLNGELQPRIFGDYTAIKKASTRRIEAIDLGRRSLHDEGAEILRSRVMDKIDIDFNTARRLFTLICIMQIR